MNNKEKTRISKEEIERKRSEEKRNFFKRMGANDWFENGRDWEFGIYIPGVVWKGSCIYDKLHQLPIYSVCVMTNLSLIIPITCRDSKLGLCIAKGKLVLWFEAARGVSCQLKCCVTWHIINDAVYLILFNKNGGNVNARFPPKSTPAISLSKSEAES